MRLDTVVLFWSALKRGNVFGSRVIFFFFLRIFQLRPLIVRLLCAFIVLDDFLHRFREDRVPLSVAGNSSLRAPPRKVPAVFAAVSFVLDVVAFTQSYICSSFWPLRQKLVEHGKVLAAIDEFEALVVLPIVELVGGWDVEGWEERGLVGDAGEVEGRVPGDGWRKVDGEGGDAVSVVKRCVSILCVILL